MTAAAVLRVVAIALAVGGLIDPSWTVAERVPLEADLAVPRAAAGRRDGSARADAAALADRLASAAGGDVAFRSLAYADGERLPCGSDVPCVVVTDAHEVPQGGLTERTAPLFVIAPEARADAAVSIDDVVVAPAHVDEQGLATVTLAGRAPAGAATTVELRDGNLPVGAASHTWSAAGPADVRMSWWPARAGRRTLTVTAHTTGAEAKVESAPVAVIVEVTAEPLPVLVIDARPSWAVTFVRRALEADARLAVDSVSGLAPGLASGRGRAVVDDARVARARVVVLGGLDALSASDVDRYRRYAAMRGGAVVLVPDAVVTGPAAGLVPGEWRRQLDSAPADAGGLRATEWLLASRLDEGDEVLAERAGRPAIVSRPVGEGRIVMVGALDAWRQRGFTGAVADASAASDESEGGDEGRTAPFARLWQDLVTRLARGTAPPVEARVSIAPGDDTAVVDVQGRTMASRPTWSASARVACGDETTVVRLVPQARAAHFRGRVALPPAGTACAVVAAMAELGETHAPLTVPARTAAKARRVVARLGELAAATGGVVASSGDVTAVAARLAALRPAATSPGTGFPARHWSWGAALGLVLGAEWWLRRRAGQR